MSHLTEDWHYRAAPVLAAENGTPSTLDVDRRSVEFILSTEAPVPMWDPARGEVVPEVLLARSGSFPKNVPLLDTHERASVQNVLGSVRDIRVEGDQVIGRAVFAKQPSAEDAFGKVQEGHITDFSAGYRINNRGVTHVPKGEEAELGGRTWRGPVNVVTSWTLKEASLVPIGADPAAKARCEPEPDEPTAEEPTMNEPTPTKTFAEIDAERKEAERIRQEELRRLREAERARQIEITAMGRQWNATPEEVDYLIQNGASVEEARKEMTETYRERTKKEGEVKTGVAHFPGERARPDERDKFRAAARDALIFRCGQKPREDYVVQRDGLGNHSLLDMARRCLQMAGERIDGQANDVFQRAMTTTDFSNLLADVQNKFLYQGWEEADTTYQIWCDTGSLPDYKTAKFPRISAFPNLTSVDEDWGEYTYKTLGDQTESVTLLHWGAIIGISLKALVNDDLGALSDVPRLQGEAARRTINNRVYATSLTGTTGAGETMGDSNALFDNTNHGNYIASGSGAAVDISTIDALAVKMAVQQDSGSNAYLNARPQYLLCHPYYFGTVMQIMQQTSPTAMGSLTSAITNPWLNMTPVFDANISINSYKWWAVAGARGKTCRVFGLNGEPRPQMDERESFTSAGWEWRVKMDFATKFLDWRFMAANYGS